MKWQVLVLVLFVCASCQRELDSSTNPKKEISKEASRDENFDYGGAGKDFKVPLPPGYSWEVTQSWGEDCEYCTANYNWEYCSETHTWNCCKFAWDFNLPGNADLGKPVLASGNGKVLKSQYSSSWGNHVVLDHGDNLCTRYGHLKDNSTNHIYKNMDVCQGLVIGEIGNTGDYSQGPHLHFQFEECDTGKSIRYEFTDGNGAPICTMGNAVFSGGKYDFLILNNAQRDQCDNDLTTQDDYSLNNGGWNFASCGALPDCPIVTNCGRESGHKFGDYYSLTTATAHAAAYLYSECAWNPDKDGALHPLEGLTIEEALRTATILFGLMEHDEDDFFHKAVTTAVDHGILNNASYLADPDQSITFAQAAKIIVKAALVADTIEMKESPPIDLQVSKSHWSYPYLATLAWYGGLVHPLMYYDADRVMERRDFIVMVASLSPCYCKNVLCSGGCKCEQAFFSCIDDEINVMGIGGDKEDDPEDSPEDIPEEPPEEEPEDYHPVPDLASPTDVCVEIDCWVEEDNTSCVSDTMSLYIKCSLENCGIEELKLNNLYMSDMMEGDGDDSCTITDNSLKNSGVGTQNVDSGDELDLNGHFEIVCEDLTLHKIAVNFDLKERIDGQVFEHQGVGVAVIDVEPEIFLMCIEETQPPPDDPPDPPETPDPPDPPETSSPPALPDDFVCDNSKDHGIFVISPGGTYEILTSQGVLYIGTLPDENTYILFDCSAFPIAFRLHGGSYTVLHPVGFQAFKFYTPYFAPVTFEPQAPYGLYPHAAYNILTSKPNMEALLFLPHTL